MEQENHHRGDNENIPETPDDISGLVDDVQDRASQRRRAFEMNLENARKAKTQEERDYWILKAMEFGDILGKYKNMYPEILSHDNDLRSPEEE